MRFKGYGRFGTVPLKPQSRTIIALRSPRELRQLEQEIAAPAVLPNHL